MCVSVRVRACVRACLCVCVTSRVPKIYLSHLSRNPLSVEDGFHCPTFAARVRSGGHVAICRWRHQPAGQP